MLATNPSAPRYPLTTHAPARPSAEQPAGRWGRYRFDHCYTLDDLLPPTGEAYAGLTSVSGLNTARAHKARSKRELAKRICLDFVALVLDDLIATGDHYQLPAGSQSILRVVAMPVRRCSLLLRQRRYRMNDVFATGGRFYQFRLELGKPGQRPRVKGVYVDMGRYHELCKRIALGQVAYDLN
jgi:hypothetical protein